VAVLVGLAATSLVVGLERAGRLNRLELRALDLRFRYANPIEWSSDLVFIDIDDGSLNLVGERWPWPRYEQAALVSVPAELGARALLVDLTWIEPEPISIDARLRTDFSENLRTLPLDQLGIQWSDYELRAAIAQSAQVYLAYFYDVLDLGRAPAMIGPDGVVARLAAGDQTGAARLAASIRPRPGAALTPLEFGRLTRALEQDLNADPANLGQIVGVPLPQIKAEYAQAQIAAARRIVAAQAAADPNFATQPIGTAFAQLCERVAHQPPDTDSPVTQTLRAALVEQHSYDATVGHWADLPANLAPAAQPVQGLVPVYYLHAEVARRCGFTAFIHDEDGVTRRLPLLVRHGPHVLPQLAFGLACDLLGSVPEPVYRDGPQQPPTHLRVGKHEIQIDNRGFAVIPWVPTGDWERGYGDRIPAGLLWQVTDRRRMMLRNEALARRQRQETIAAFFAEGPDYRKACTAVDELRRRAAWARYDGDRENAARVAEQVTQAAADLETREQELTRAGQALTTRPAAELTPAETQRRSNVEFGLQTLRDADAEQQRIAAINAALQREIDGVLAYLRPKLAGKVCLIGYTATALADMTPIPTQSQAVPGVLAHANLLNGLLAGRTVTWAPAWANVLLIFVMGLVSTAISVWRRPREALVLVGGLCVVYAALAGWAAFYYLTHWLGIVAPLAAAIASQLAITFYFYVFVERESRQLATALGQYTSRSLARQMAENPELCKRAEMREVTVIFTDLKGFTTISERIGAARTQHVLNVCLGRFTEAMLAHEALVSKFLGDGIFAFWNPVIFEQPDHALRACLTAVDLLDALVRLRQEQAAADPTFAQLVVRVGVATGMAVVGPCGSEQKYDYTCIGDSVNVASRLESANKFFGTSLLVNGETRAAAGERFAFRALGGVQVKGKRQAVPVFELLGRSGTVPAELVTHAEQFARAVELFQQRQWEPAAELFGQCLQARPEDLAAARYAETCARYAQQPPDEDWNGAIELMEK
jgi:class 3 adenylate cyclase